jgi:UDP-N-acetylglucosamine 2-epimerase (non-hydrolysing)
MCGLKPERMLESVAIVGAHALSGDRPFRMIPDYEADNVSKKMVRIIMSYTDYVNRTVWRKS